MKNYRIAFVLSLLVFVSLACNASSELINLFNNEALESTTETVVEAPILESSTSSVVVSEDLVSQQDALISLYDAVSPGVVSIFVASPEGTGQGSGFVIDQAGHIVTNFHVVENATYMEVSFPSGLKALAEVIGEDTDSDLAIIKVNVAESELIPLALGNSQDLQVGQIVVAIGNPFGLSGSMSTGIVSSLGRSLDSLNVSGTGQFFSAGDIIQTDAAINPGNSGGPLLNLSGQVIGINRAIRTFNVSETGSSLNSGVGFAVSVDILKRVAPSLIATGHYDYPFLGLSSISNLTLADAQQLGLDRTLGVFISEVSADGPADTAGIQVGDLILAVNGEDLADFNQMISYLFVNTSPGDTINFLVLRDGSEINLDLVLGARP
jgi:2-alkenal reductase